MLLPTRVGQVYVYDSPKGEQDEYDFPRHLLSSGSQEIYDVPPVRGALPSQVSQGVRLLVGLRGGSGVAGCGDVAPSAGLSRDPLCVCAGAALLPLTCCPVSSQQVYDTPPMAVKGPNGQDPGQEIYDVPPSVEKNLHQTVSAAGKACAPKLAREGGGAAGLRCAHLLPRAHGMPRASAYVHQGAARASGTCTALPPYYAAGPWERGWCACVAPAALTLRDIALAGI